MEAEAIKSCIDLSLKINPADRPNCDRLNRYLTDFYECRLEERKNAQKMNTFKNINNCGSEIDSIIEQDGIHGVDGDGFF